MSWDYSQEYACISFDRVVQEEELRSMLAELSIKLLNLHLRDPYSLYHLEDTACELENQEITREQALEQITEISQNFLREIDHEADSTSLIVIADEESEYSDTDMAKEIAKHLFSKTKESHFIWRRAAFDKYGAYSHQWIGFWQDGQIELIHTDDYFASQFAAAA
jgi:hypothetical protein